MVLRIFKIVVTSGFRAALECTKFVFGRGSAPDPTGGALGDYSAPPDHLAGLRGRTYKGRGGKKRERKMAEEGNGRDRPPFANSWIRPCRDGSTRVALEHRTPRVPALRQLTGAVDGIVPRQLLTLS